VKGLRATTTSDLAAAAAAGNDDDDEDADVVCSMIVLATKRTHPYWPSNDEGRSGRRRQLNGRQCSPGSSVKSFSSPPSSINHRVASHYPHDLYYPRRQ